MITKCFAVLLSSSSLDRRFGGWTALVLLCCWCASTPTQADFVYSDFSSVAGLNLVEDAAQAGAVLRLNESIANQGGGAWTVAKQLVAGGFQSTFQYQITNLTGNGADGFAFVIQNESVSSFSVHSAQMGYGDHPSTAGITNSLAIEFDTYGNDDLGDPSANHVGVNSRGILENSADHNLASLGFAIPPFNLSDGAVHTVDVVYDALGSLLTVTLDGAVTPLLSVNVNFSTLLNLDNGAAFVGFTSGTGADSERHDILNWSFDSLEAVAVPEPSSLALMGLGILGLAIKAHRRRTAG